MRKINKIIIHCSATPEAREHNAEDIRGWHKKQGFSDIGYHYIIKLDGSIEQGRPESISGAHCVGHNNDSIGVCYIGGCDKAMKPKDTRTVKQTEALRKLIQELRLKYPAAKVYGHNDFDKGKACPSFNIKDI